MKKLIILFLLLSFLPSSVSAQSINKEGEALYLAKKAYEDGFHEVALNLFKRFLKNFPQSQNAIEANLYIAQCYFHQDKFIIALTQLEQLYSEPNSGDLKDSILYWIAEVHFRGNDFKKAISFYQRIIEGFPDSDFLYHTYYSRGWALYKLGNFSEAIEDFSLVSSNSQDSALRQDAEFKN